MVRRKDLIGNLPAPLAANAAERSRAGFAKLAAAKDLIERNVATGVISPNSVTLKMLLKDYAGLNHRFLDRKVYANRKEDTLAWIARLESNGVAPPDEETNTANVISQQRKEIAELKERVEKMADRVHFYASRIRDLQRTVRQLKKKSLETVVYLRDRPR